MTVATDIGPVLAIDPGSRSGWALSDGTSGVADFRRHDGHGHLGWRFAGWFGDMLVETGASIVVIERQFRRDDNGANVLLGLRMMALTACYGHDRMAEEVSEATWKKWARKNLPEWVKDDEADARALLAYWLAVRAPKVEAA